MSNALKRKSWGRSSTYRQLAKQCPPGRVILQDLIQGDSPAPAISNNFNVVRQLRSVQTVDSLESK